MRFGSDCGRFADLPEVVKVLSKYRVRKFCVKRQKSTFVMNGFDSAQCDKSTFT
jgi:hypothetical protein